MAVCSALHFLSFRSFFSERMLFFLFLLISGQCYAKIIVAKKGEHYDMSAGLIHETPVSHRRRNRYQHRHHHHRHKRDKHHMRHLRELRQQLQDDFDYCQAGGQRYCLKEFKDSKTTCGYYETDCIDFYHRYMYW